MHAAVEQGAQETRASRHVLGSYPPQGEHGGVVVDVEEAQLVVPLPQDDEQTV